MRKEDTLSASGTSIKRLTGRFFVALVSLANPMNSDWIGWLETQG